MGDRKSIPLPTSSFDLIIICVNTSHPGNLGAICRTMLNYGFSKLRLVTPKCDPLDEEARNRAKHAGSILDELQTFSTFQEAVKDCSLVVGTSGKREVGTKTSFRHFCYPWELSTRFSGINGKIALVFGGEGTGLSTEQLHDCDFLATLPTWEGYPIANLSHSVNAFLYQIHSDRVKDSQGSDFGLPDIVPLTRELHPELRGTLLTAVSQFSAAMPGNQERKDSMNNSLVRMIMMSSPTSDEVTRIIGGLIDATTALQKNNNNAEWINMRRRRIE
jgi:TrmH family RNA methyltransferase